jgi:uncharacterized protein YcbK (DUF882 family)
MTDTFIRDRWLVQTGVISLLVVGFFALAKNTFASVDKRLSFYHTHTGERLDVVYSRNGEYIPAALDSINRFLSDFRTGDVTKIDPELLDIIYDVREELGSDGTYQVISAFRSPRTNEMLRGRSASSGVAKNSQHTHGRAIDVRLEGVPTTKLRQQALAMKRGGVGYYADSDFVHMDTGRVRSW